MKILEIDDNSDIIQFVETIVTSMGHEFTSADNGRDGLRLIEENKYDLVLLDLSMPEFSGVDVINALVEKDIMKNQKIILFTASAEGNLGELLEKGIHSCLEKPVDIDVLMDTINGIESSQ